MLPSHHRLRSRHTITRLYRKGRRRNHDGVFLIWQSNHLPTTRATIVISKKFSMKAVHRNRQRRVISAVLENLCPDCTHGFDLLISSTKGTKMLSYKEVTTALEILLADAGIRIH